MFKRLIGSLHLTSKCSKHLYHSFALARPYIDENGTPVVIHLLCVTHIELDGWNQSKLVFHIGQHFKDLAYPIVIDFETNEEAVKELFFIKQAFDKYYNIKK